ncbi:3'(2'),5'-bisphosphate nucleotidase CysQ [Oleidesulfovibrio sp.]|uniref:3'(2'),5'-bisphosphate nucleotidase CysQ n=1 Tax=Oleidesulfovibrio sp. TaxID=2909707 RepID=UPI003A842CF3
MSGHCPFSDFITLAHRAGAEIAARQNAIVRAGADAVFRKDDNSPVTKADKAASTILCEGLAVLAPDIPVISEEEAIPPLEVRRSWQEYFLVDPLDGTKGYLRGDGDYSVCIALMRNNQPVAGIIHVPARDVTYYGSPEAGAWKVEAEGKPQQLYTRTQSPEGSFVVLQSRVTSTPRLDAYMGGTPHTRLIASSAYKFCLLAEGLAQLYPCLHPTWEWDTAAGQAILHGAGGVVTDLEGLPLQYGKQSLLNDSFVARA